MRLSAEWQGSHRGMAPGGHRAGQEGRLRWDCNSNHHGLRASHIPALVPSPFKHPRIPTQSNPGM